MKKLILLFAVSLLISGAVFSQNNDKDLYAKYSKEEVELLKKENPQEYSYVKYCAKNAFYVAKLPKEKVAANAEKFGEVTIKNLSNINFYELNIDIDKEKSQYFIIKGTDQLLVVRSKNYILQKIKKK